MTDELKHEESAMESDSDLLNWLQNEIVDVIYLDDGRLIDVAGLDVREAIRKTMARAAAPASEDL